MLKRDLTKKQIERVKAAAKYVGMPWQEIIRRPKTAMHFCRRVEAEIEREASL